MPTPTDTIGDVLPLSSDCYWLHAPTEFKAAVTLGQGLPTEIHGQPVKYFWANGIASGSYTHPTKGFNLSVNRQRIDGWVANFQRTKANGVRIPVNVDHSNSARDAMGFVVDMRRDGDTLKVLHQLIGDDAIRLASRNEISLGINPAFTDGRGINYGDTIVHSALTPVPVIPAQGGLIAASREGGDGSDSPTILVLSQTEKEATMALTDFQLAAFRRLPGAADVAADDAAQWLIDYSTQMTSNCENLLSRAQSAEGKVQNLSRKAEAVRPTSAELHYLARTLEMSRNAAIKVAGAEIVNKAMRRLLKTDTFDTETLTLSRNVCDDDIATAEGMRSAVDFFDLLQFVKPPVNTGPRTGPQGAFELSRRIGGGDEEDENAPLSKEKRAAILGASSFGRAILDNAQK